MKLCIGNTPVGSLNIRKLDVDTNDATIVPSDMQSGSIAYAKGKKITGTGKAFAFAFYGNQRTNSEIPVPDTVNIVEISSLLYPIKMLLALSDMKSADFSVETEIASVTIDGTEYPITAQSTNNVLMLGCNQNINLQIFYGKDEHV